MGIFSSSKQKDINLGNKFVFKFPFIIVSKDKITGRIVLIFRSKNEAVLEIGTSQTEIQELNSVLK